MKKKLKLKNKKIWILVAIAAVAAIFLILSVFPSGKTDVENHSTSSPMIVAAVATSSPFDHVSVTARAAYVLDATNGHVLFAKNETTPLPLASITKLMTALTASKALTSDDVISVATSSLVLDGDNGLIAGERWRFQDLLDFTLMVSSNDGANTIALSAASAGLAPDVLSAMSTTTLEENFVTKMNAEAASLNLPTFHFQNESGLDVNPVTPGAVGSARDVARLLQYLIEKEPNLIEITKYKSFKFVSESGINHTVSNTDEAISKISHLIASKTGYTLLAGGNLAIAYDPGLNHPIIIVVLGSTTLGRFSDTISLASSTSAYLRNAI